MQPMQQSHQAYIDTRYRVMLILWFAFLSSIGVYYVVSLFIQRPNADGGQSRVLTFALTALGTFMAIVSTAVKQKFLLQSVEKQQIALVQTGFIVAMAFCETAALLGLMDRSLTGNRYYFVLLVIAAIGMVFHFPRRDQLLAATYRSTKPGGGF